MQIGVYLNIYNASFAYVNNISEHMSFAIFNAINQLGKYGDIILNMFTWRFEQTLSIKLLHVTCPTPSNVHKGCSMNDKMDK